MSEQLQVLIVECADQLDEDHLEALICSTDKFTLINGRKFRIILEQNKGKDHVDIDMYAGNDARYDGEKLDAYDVVMTKQSDVGEESTYLKMLKYLGAIPQSREIFFGDCNIYASAGLVKAKRQASMSNKSFLERQPNELAYEIAKAKNVGQYSLPQLKEAYQFFVYQVKHYPPRSFPDVLERLVGHRDKIKHAIDKINGKKTN